MIRKRITNRWGLFFTPASNHQGGRVDKPKQARKKAKAKRQRQEKDRKRNRK